MRGVPGHENLILPLARGPFWIWLCLVVIEDRANKEFPGSIHLVTPPNRF